MSAYAAAERAKADWEKGFSALIWFGKTRGHLRVLNSYHAPRTGFHLADWRPVKGLSDRGYLKFDSHGWERATA